MKSKLIIFIVPFALFATQGCSLMHNPGHSYNDDDEYAAYAAQKNGLADTFEELGYSPTKKLTEEEEMAITKRLKLKRLERDLSDRERKQYYELKTYMENDDERIYFLGLPDTEARERYAIQKGFYFKTTKLAPEVKEAISKGDIVPGMTREAVTQSWGEPVEIEIAGNRQFGNEKWTYLEFITTPEGFQKEERVVIFESGKVAGWRRYQ